MLTSTKVNSVAPPEEIALGGVTHSDTPVVILLRGSAGNDATSGDPATSQDQGEPGAQQVTSGIGDIATAHKASSARMIGYELHPGAGALRSLVLGDNIIAAIRAAVVMVRRGYARYRKRREAWAVYDALRELDDRTLRDLGFDRSEIRSVVAEVTGKAEHTRVLTLWTTHGPPG
jgi:uncharacterized protein YjiS (DUF1127 family)